MTTPAASTWDLLTQALLDRRPIRARYHGHDRILCPHLLGWKNGRPKVLAYQTSGTTSTGHLPGDSRQRWRSLFVDELEHATLADEPWQSAGNYTLTPNCVDRITLALPLN